MTGMKINQNALKQLCQNSFTSLLKRGLPLEKGSTLKKERISFSLEKISFQKKFSVQESKQEVTKLVAALQNGGKSILKVLGDRQRYL